MHLVLFDLETTGFSPQAAAIIQIAAARMRGGAILDESFATFVRPERPIPAEITALTGITDVDVADAPALPDALKAFATFIGDGILVAHSGKSFDLPFLEAAAIRCGRPLRPAPFIDSIDLSRMLWPNEKSHRLDAVIERLGLTVGDLHRHDARADVRLLAESVFEMWRRLGFPFSQSPVPLREGRIPCHTVDQDQSRP